MRIFVTGASGFVGSAVVPELISAGHEVTGLARSDASAAKLTAAGASVLRGELADLDTLRRGAEASDGVIHLAFIHDFARFAENVRVDNEAIQTLGTALKGSDRPLLITGGTAGLPAGRVTTERDTTNPEHPLSARSDNERLALSFVEQGVRAGTVRLAPTVHGEGDRGFMAAVIGVARATGVSAYVGDGANRWPALHRLDTGSLYRLAIENAPAGSVLHGIADQGVPLREVAEIIGRHLDLPVISVAPEDAMTHFGFLGGLLSADIPSSSGLTQELLGWAPTHPGLVEDLELGHYFTSELGDMLHG